MDLGVYAGLTFEYVYANNLLLLQMVTVLQQFHDVLFFESKEKLTMGALSKKMVDQAMSLPSNARLSLIEKLIESQNLPIQKEIDQIWSEEAERRITEIDKGKVELIPGEKVFAEVRERFGR